MIFKIVIFPIFFCFINSLFRNSIKTLVKHKKKIDIMS